MVRWFLGNCLAVGLMERGLLLLLLLLLFGEFILRGRGEGMGWHRLRVKRLELFGIHQQREDGLEMG